MCCFFAALFFVGPRFAFLIYWLTPFGRLKVLNAFDTWVWPMLGLVFIPWTTLAYTLLAPIVWFDWLFLVMAIAADLFSWLGYRARR